MALTKLNFYLVLILIVGTITYSLIGFGIDLKTSERAILDDNSNDYIDLFSDYTDTQGMDDFYNVDTTEYTETNLLLGDNETGEFATTDNFGVVSFFKSKFAPFTNMLQRVTSIPSFIILSLGINPVYVSGIVTTLVFIMVVGLVVLFIKIMNGGSS